MDEHEVLHAQREFTGFPRSFIIVNDVLSQQVESCTGTFSAGSWMGIMTALVLISISFFGILMLNSVQVSAVGYSIR